MYHAHHHGQLQVPNGLFGTIIIGDTPLPLGRTVGGIEVPADLVPVTEIPMVLNDAGVIGYSLNGKSFPATEPLVVGLDDWFVVHYYNEGLQIHPMHLHGFPQLVFSKDGYPLDQPVLGRHSQRCSGRALFDSGPRRRGRGLGVALPHPQPRRERRRNVRDGHSGDRGVRVMLVYYFGHVNGTLDQVSTAICAAEGEVSAWARLAYRKGEELRTRIDPGPFMPAKEVEIVLGQPMGRSGSVIIPMDWKATGVGALFPVMSADLVLQPLGPGLVEVIFRGSYKPPLRGIRVGSSTGRFSIVWPRQAPRPSWISCAGRSRRQSPQMGRSTRTVVPRPRRLWRVVSPPAFSARLRRLDSPNPDSTAAGSKPFP